MPADAGAAIRGYDRIAPDYDRMVRRDLWMRQVLWRHYRRVFQPGDRVLDVGCGTGLDSLFLAQQGIQVAGIDASSGMIAELRRKAERSGLVVDSRIGRGDDLHAWANESFHGIVSSFAGLNALGDMTAFAGETRRVLKPGGRLVAHMLGPHHLWHLLALLGRGEWRGAAKYCRRREEIIVVEGQPMRHLLLPPRATYTRFFARFFRLRRCYALGFLRPRGWDHRLPETLMAWSGRAEGLLGRSFPLRNWGMFFVLDLEKR